MRTIYLNSEFKCYVVDDGTMTAVETDYFDGKCDTFIQGYRFIPEGESWTRSDGVTFKGQMIFPWMSYDKLSSIQQEYEKQLLADFESALAEIETALGV